MSKKLKKKLSSLMGIAEQLEGDQVDLLTAMGMEMLPDDDADGSDDSDDSENEGDDSSEKESSEIIQLDGREYRVGSKNGVVDICRDENHRSCFRWHSEKEEWAPSSENDISLGKLVDLVSRCPELADVFCRHRRSADE